MGPVFADLQNKTDGEPALLVTLDLTNQTTRNQAELHAAALGLSDLWISNGGSTGKVHLVNGASKATIATLTHEQSLKDMTAALKSALQ